MNKKILDFVTSLERAISLGLPGESAQLKMAPRFRKPTGFDEKSINQARQGAVLILLYPADNTIKTILIKRPEYNGHHSSQVSFPGGKHEEGDDNYYTTALRETEEEIGLDKSGVKFIGSMSTLYIPVSNFNVHPFMAYTSDKPLLKRNEREVESIIEFDIEQLNSSDIKAERKIKLSNGLELSTPCYDINGNIVWGATAMIISEMHELIHRLN